MWFLNPGLLWLLPLAAVPVIIHLFFLRKAKHIKFSDLTLLRKAYLKSLPASRLRQWLLLAIRCLLLAALILAFARPVIQSGEERVASGADDEVQVVLLVDTSYSMSYHVQGKTRLEQCQNVGEQILRMLRPQDKAAVAAFSTELESSVMPAKLEWSKDIANAISSLKRLSVGNRGTNFLPPLQAAYDFLKGSKNRRRVIIVLSDNAAHGWRSVDTSRVSQQIQAYDPSILLLGIGWADHPENAALIDGETRSTGSKGVQMEIRAFLDSGSRQGWDVDLWQSSRRTDQRHVNLTSGLEVPVDFSIAPGDEAGTWGRVQMRQDQLPEDDVFYYSFWQQKRPKVLLVTGGSRSLDVGRGGYFLKKLFTDVQGSLLPYDLEIADAVRVKELHLADYRAAILIDFKSVEADLASSLERYVRSGGGIWLVMSKGVDPRGYQSLSRLIPGRIGDLMESSAPEGRGIKAAPDLDAQSGGKVSWKDFELQNVIVRRTYMFEPASGSHIWFRDSSGRPLMVLGSYGEGQVMIWTSTLDIDWTNIGVKPMFAASIDQAIGALSKYSNRREWRTTTVGEPIARVWSESEPAPASVRIRAPEGKSVLAQVVQRRIRYIPETPGMYFLEFNAGSSAQSEAYAVNLDRSAGESNLSVPAVSPWRMLRPEALKEDFIGALYGRETRTAALGLAILLMLAETLLANPRQP